MLFVKNASCLLLGLSLSFASYAATYALKVTEEGFVPNAVNAKAGEDVVLDITRVTDSTCAQDIQVPSKKIKADLPLNKAVKIKVGKVSKGDIAFGCSMGMMVGGTIKVR